MNRARLILLRRRRGTHPLSIQQHGLATAGDALIPFGPHVTFQKKSLGDHLFSSLFAECYCWVISRLMSLHTGHSSYYIHTETDT